MGFIFVETKTSLYQITAFFFVYAELGFYR